MNEQYCQAVSFKVNGREHSFIIGKDFGPEDSLAKVLREKLGYTGVKLACGQGACGACTVLLDGESVLSCMMTAASAHGSEVLTIEGLPEDDPVIAAFVEMNEPDYGTAMQCGFCTPGFVLETHALLGRSPKPSRDEIKDELSGHICRCGCYKGIMRAVELASEKMEGGCAVCTGNGQEAKENT
ncbi:MAG: (2Fe-2S)-binding protein [Clostridiales bacterium]|nr:(2Fe-2S)-binding protein [Clostridiales bacterium]